MQDSSVINLYFEFLEQMRKGEIEQRILKREQMD